MVKIVVKNKDWNSARAELKSTLDAQHSAFQASLQAFFAPPAPAGEAEAPKGDSPTKAPERRSTLARPAPRGLPRSRLA